MQPVSSQPLLSEEDYGAIEAAVMETARGRWFLAEYARRNRNADTAAVLAAIRRLERLVENNTSMEARDEVARGMASIAQAIAAAEVPPANGAGETHGGPVPSPARVEALHERLFQAYSEAAAEQQGEPVADMTDVSPAEAQPGSSPEVEPEVAHELAAEAASQTVAAQDEPDAPPPQPEPAAAVLQDDVLLDQGAEAEAAVDTPAAPSVDAQPEPVEMRDEPAVEEAEIPVPEEKAADIVARAGETVPPTPGAEPFPILELDDEAADALLAKDSQRQELILPVKHLAASRRSRLDMAKLLAVPRDTPADAPPARPSRPGLVTFVDEEPVENAMSVFSAPLRLEPEEPSGKETEAQALTMSSSWNSRLPTAPRLTVAEIEAMPFKKRAALFS